jgi:transposase
MKAFIGIDVSKDTLDVCWLRDAITGKKKSKSLKNNPQGWALLYQWLVKTTGRAPKEMAITLEPTGVYHEGVMYGLHAQGFTIDCVNPAKAKDYAKSLNQTHKTDSLDALCLASYGHARQYQFTPWEPESDTVRALKAKVRRLEALNKDLQRELNRKESYEVSAASDVVIDSSKQMIEVLKQQINALSQDIDDDIDKDPTLKKDRELLHSIKGVGEVVSRHMLSLFSAKHFKNAKQVAAYLGLIPKLNESGKQKGKTTLSKKGPSDLRAKLYMAAVVATTHNPEFKALKQRLIARGKSKMVAICAAMRKLVQVCFGVIKHQSEYAPQIT